MLVLEIGNIQTHTSCHSGANLLTITLPKLPDSTTLPTYPPIHAHLSMGLLAGEINKVLHMYG